MNISEEQSCIANALKSGYNVVTSAVPGSGKTTTGINTANILSDLRICLLTYNTDLCSDTNARCKRDEITNLHAFTLHGVIAKHYRRPCFNDEHLEKFLAKSARSPEIPLPKWDIIIIDEAQDITPALFAICIQIIYDVTKTYKAPSILVMGDEDQCLYEYQFADRRFISYASKIFGLVSVKPWRILQLSQTFRMPIGITNFINKVCLPRDKIRSVKPGPSDTQVRYVIADTWDTKSNKQGEPNNGIYKEIKHYLALGYNPEDIMIISNTIDNNPAVQAISNILSLKKFKIFVPSNDEDKIPSEVLFKKLKISSINQSKGLESSVIIVLGADDFYFKMNTKLDPNILPNLYYVAFSRPRDYISIIQNTRNLPFGFIKLPKLTQYAKIINYSAKNRDSNLLGLGDELLAPLTGTELPRPRQYWASKITNHLPYFILRKALNCITLNKLADADLDTEIQIPVHLDTGDGLFEQVADITGTYIPALWDCKYSSTGKPEILMACWSEISSGRNTNFRKYWNPRWLSSDYDLKKHPSEIIKIAALYNSIRNNLLFKMEQIRNFNYITADQIKECMIRIDKLFKTYGEGKLQFETFVKYDSGTASIRGYIDVLDATTIYELKFKSVLSPTDIIQSALYLLMMKAKSNDVLSKPEYTDIRMESLKSLKIGHVVEFIHDKKYQIGRVTNLLDGDITPHSIEIMLGEKAIKCSLDCVFADLTALKRAGYLKTYRCILYNIRTGETVEISGKTSKLVELVQILLEAKNRAKDLCNDSEFIQLCVDIVDKVYISPQSINMEELTTEK